MTIHDYNNPKHFPMTEPEDKAIGIPPLCGCAMRGKDHDIDESKLAELSEKWLLNPNNGFTGKDLARYLVENKKEWIR